MKKDLRSPNASGCSFCAFSIAFCIASAILLGGCADPLEKPVVQEAQEKFQRGITGNGTLGPVDRSDDPTIRETHP